VKGGKKERSKERTHGRKGNDLKWREEKEIREAFMWRKVGQEGRNIRKGRKEGTK